MYIEYCLILPLVTTPVSNNTVAIKKNASVKRRIHCSRLQVCISNRHGGYLNFILLFHFLRLVA